MIGRWWFRSAGLGKAGHAFSAAGITPQGTASGFADRSRVLNQMYPRNQ